MDSVVQFIYGLNPNYVGIFKWIVLIALLIMVAILFNYMLKSEQLKQKYNNIKGKGYDSIVDRMQHAKVKAFNYEELDSYIKRSGLEYMSKGKLTPVSYMGLKIGFALLGTCAGLQVNLLAGIGFMVVGYLALDFIVDQSNQSDNKAMLNDIKNIYDTLRIQTKAGVYITSVLTDCYLVVQNKRLKQALLKLTSDIAATNDMEESLNNLKAKFTNQYIDTMVIIIKQSLQTGQAAKMFDDIKGQINDIEAAMVLNEKQKIATRILIVQLMIYLLIVIVTLFVAFISLQQGLSG